MEAKLGQLEKAVSRAVRQLAELQKHSTLEPAAKKKKPAGPDHTAALSQSVTELSRENRRLREERKELRKRVRAIIRAIDKVKW